ncbi:hypothetical protein C7E25_25100, partial [Stenotrophomonas maltophilia]
GVLARRLYRGLWRFASVSDLLNIFKASFIGMVAAAGHGVLARRLYRGLWRFASVSDLLNIFKASFIGMVA